MLFIDPINDGNYISYIYLILEQAEQSYKRCYIDCVNRRKGK